jgi:hypothetical protein
MRQHASNAGKKLLALVILLVAAWVLLKIVIGFVVTIAWVVVAVLAVVALVWAIRVL